MKAWPQNLRGFWFSAVSSPGCWAGRDSPGLPVPGAPNLSVYRVPGGEVLSPPWRPPGGVLCCWSWGGSELEAARGCLHHGAAVDGMCFGFFQKQQTSVMLFKVSCFLLCPVPCSKLVSCSVKPRDRAKAQQCHRGAEGRSCPTGWRCSLRLSAALRLFASFLWCAEQGALGAQLLASLAAAACPAKVRGAQRSHSN